MSKEEIIVETLTRFFDEIKEEYRGLKRGSYDKERLKGYNDLIWDIKIILKDNHNIEVKMPDND